MRKDTVPPLTKFKSNRDNKSYFKSLLVSCEFPKTGKVQEKGGLHFLHLQWNCLKRLISQPLCVSSRRDGEGGTGLGAHR